MAKNYRSAVSGRFVTKAYANKNPRTTVGETNKPKGGSKGKGKKGK